MAAQFEIDSVAFFDRLKKVYDAWKANKNEESWGGADALVINAGESNDDVIYKKSSAIQIWLFNYEFPETILLLTASSVKVLTSPKKVQIFKANIVDSSGGPVPVEFIAKGTDQAKDFKLLIDSIQKSYGGKAYGTLMKEKPQGKWIEAWAKELQAAGFKAVDINGGFADVLAIKDEKEQKNIRTAATISSYVLKSKLLPAIETVIDEERAVSHQTLAEEAEKIFEDPSVISKKLQKDQLDTCFTPIIQSGGNYDLKFSAVNDDKRLSFDTIVCSLGAKFKSYCTAVARTYLVDPIPFQTDVYQTLLDVQQLLISSLKPGVKLSTVYNKAIEMVSSKQDLVDKFTKSCGFAMGLEFRDAVYEINAKNNRTVKAGMVFNVAIGFHNVPLPASSKQKQFSVFLADTVLVKEGSTEILTDKASKNTSDITYYLETEDPNDAQVKKEDKPKPKPAPKIPSVSTAVIESKFRESTVLRKEEKTKLLEADAKRREHQKQLEQKAKEEAAERFLKGKKKESGPARTKDVESYRDASQFPKDLIKNKIFVDNLRESIFLPIYGIVVPFHISVIKNASKTDEEFLRINFVTPDAGGAANKTEIVQAPKAMRIKEMTYRFSDSKDLNNSLRLIKELRKRFNEREVEGKTRASIIEQEKLVLSKARNPRLTDLFVRPNPVGRRTAGALEAHVNGFRFTPMKGDSIDILYKNIKHAFFQPAEKELIVLIHFHLHNAIMVGKKKTVDIQFCTEVMEVSQSLDGRRYDQDELEDENRERQMRQRLNNEFQNFVRKVEDISVDFDIPYRDLGFHGVPHRSSVFLQPTVHCLVNLTETPFFVLTLGDIEIAYFERVQFNVKNFDLVFVFKDYERPVAHINSIPAESLDTIKEWLDQCDIKYYEGTQNLNWARIMPAINEDPVKFHTEDGGWGFLNAESSDEEGSDDEPSEDDFNPSGSDDGESESEDEEEDEEAYEDEDDEEEPLSDEEEEEGEDWDQLEEKAKKQDMEEKEKKRARGESDDSEDDTRRSKKTAKRAPRR